MSLTRLLCLLTSTLLMASATRMIGYYGIYEYTNGCPNLTPDMIPAEDYTHMIFAFIPIDSNQVPVQPDNTTQSYFTQINNMRQRNSNLKTMISFGGWAMNMSLWSVGVSTVDTRSRLVSNIITYVRQWGFDGMDFDWEYPVAPERGGAPNDAQNFADFIAAMRTAVNAEQVPSGKSKLEVSIPLPGGAFYGQYYLLDQIIPNLDFANIMAYNLHGPWEDQVFCSANFYDNTNSSSKYHGYSIYDAVTYFMNQNGKTIDASKLNLGVTFAAGTYTLSNPQSSNPPGSSDSGAGLGGVCTKEPGYLAYFEIETILNQTGIKPEFDQAGYCKYFTYGDNQWVGYDDAETLSKKVGLVEKLGLGGISIWAMYAESSTGPVLQNSIHNALYNGTLKNSSSTTTGSSNSKTSTSTSSSSSKTSTTSSTSSSSKTPTTSSTSSNSNAGTSSSPVSVNSTQGGVNNNESNDASIASISMVLMLVLSIFVTL